MPTANKPKSLPAKLAEVMGLIDKPIAKKGVNASQHYSFVNESDVSAAIRPLLAERGIWLHSTELEQELVPLFTTSSGTQMWLTRVKFAFQFIDGESGDRTEVQVYSGQGADTGDKSLPKAQSMALKYFLLKSFMLSTGKDDAESDDRVDKAAAASGAARGSRVRRSNQAGVERGGKTDLTTEAQVDEITRLAVALGLKAPDLAPVIKAAIGVEPPTGTKARDWLGTLRAEQAASIIAALSELSVDKPVDESGETDEPAGETAKQEELPIA